MVPGAIWGELPAVYERSKKIYLTTEAVIPLDLRETLISHTQSFHRHFSKLHVYNKAKIHAERRGKHVFYKNE